MEIKITLLDKIALALFYMFLACGVISILLYVLIKLEHGEAYASALAFAFIWLWSRARDIIRIKEGKKFWEKHEIYCKSCKYKQENDK